MWTKCWKLLGRWAEPARLGDSHHTANIITAGTPASQVAEMELGPPWILPSRMLRCQRRFCVSSDSGGPGFWRAGYHPDHLSLRQRRWPRWNSALHKSHPVGRLGVSGDSVSAAALEGRVLEGRVPSRPLESQAARLAEVELGPPWIPPSWMARCQRPSMGARLRLCATSSGIPLPARRPAAMHARPVRQSG